MAEAERESLCEAPSRHWSELHPKYGPNAWELRVCDDFWYRVFGNRVVLSPQGVGMGAYASTEAAKATAERMYRQNLQRQVERGNRLVLNAKRGVGDALVSGPGTTQHEWQPLGFWRTLRFFTPGHPHRQRAATWRHFGWEFEVEILRRYYSVCLRKIEAGQ